MPARRLQVNPSWVLVALLGINILFTAWPGLSQFNKEDWSRIELTPDQQEAAFDQYKKSLFLWESGYYHRPFPLSATSVSWEQYVWLITERLEPIILVILFLYSKVNKQDLWVFLILKSGDLADHLVHYNEPYFKTGPFDVSYNVLSTVFFLAYILSRKHGIPSQGRLQ